MENDQGSKVIVPLTCTDYWPQYSIRKTTLGYLTKQTFLFKIKISNGTWFLYESNTIFSKNILQLNLRRCAGYLGVSR